MRAENRDAAVHPYLCDHAGDVASLRGQEDGVGLFGKVGESSDVLLGNTQRGCSISVLPRTQSKPRIVNTLKNTELTVMLRCYNKRCD